MNKALKTKKKIEEKSQQVAGFIVAIIDFFYPPFKKIIPLQTFRYAACGGGNQLLNLAIFSAAHNFVFNKQVVRLGPLNFEPYIAAFGVSFVITFPIGFMLSRYVVFNESDLKGRHQAIRYFSIVGICLLLNYALLKLLVKYWGWYPTPAMLLTIIVVVLFSYITQKKFAFKIK